MRTCFEALNSATVASALIALCSLLLSSSHKNAIGSVLSSSSSRYAVVVDAGSSGSRVRIYNWAETDPQWKLPNISEPFHHLQKEPGVSSYAYDQRELRNYVVELIEYAVENVPVELHEKTPIYFLATAGMRFMLEKKANEAIKVIGEMLSNKSINPFKFASVNNARILSGEEEGVFAWIAANYLDNAFSTHGHNQTHTRGVLEMGGASTQIVFQSVFNILANKFPVTVAGTTYYLYVKSYLSYGQDEVDKWIKEQLADENKDNRTILNPCMLRGHENADLIGTGAGTAKVNVTFVGTGQPSVCLRMLRKLVYNPPEPWRCSPKPCAIGTTYQPTIQAWHKFYAVGAFIYTLEAIGIISMSDDGHFTPDEVNRAAFNFCSEHIDSIKSRMNTTAVKKNSASPSEKNNRLSKNCLVGLYMPLLFTKGYRFSNNSKQISAPKKLGGQSVEWALGAIIYDLENGRCMTQCSKQQQQQRHPTVNASRIPACLQSSAPISQEGKRLPVILGCMLTSISLYFNYYLLSGSFLIGW